MNAKDPYEVAREIANIIVGAFPDGVGRAEVARTDDGPLVIKLHPPEEAP